MVKQLINCSKKARILFG